MSMNRLVRVSALALTLAALPVLAGCGGSNPFKPPVDDIHKLPGDTPLNDTPQNTMIRFRAAYQHQDITQYKNLLTADFRYAFSAQSDPALAALYTNNWGKDDETESATHLLTGFTNSGGTYVPPASAITISFINDQYYADPAHSDSAAYYFYCPVNTVDLAIDVPSGGTSTTYNISAPHSFFLVRGDAALLDAGQAADANHWYIRHWDDLSPASPTGAVLQIASADRQTTAGNAFSAPVSIKASWGGIKGQYAH